MAHLLADHCKRPYRFPAHILSTACEFDMAFLSSVFVVWLFKSLRNLGPRKRTWVTIFQWRRGSIKRRSKKWKLKNRRKYWQGEKMKDLSHRRKCKYCVCKTRLEIAIDRVVIPTNFFGFVTKESLCYLWKCNVFTVNIVSSSTNYAVNEGTQFFSWRVF